MTARVFVTHSDVLNAAARVADNLKGVYETPHKLSAWGVPRGGIPAAYAVAWCHGNMEIVEHVNNADIIIDDIFDSGATCKRFAIDMETCNKPFHVLFDKQTEPWKDKWLVMPWEVDLKGNDASATDIVTRLFEYIGEDPTREGLLETPQRYLLAWKEWTAGYGVDTKSLLKTFTDGAEQVSEMVIVNNIPVFSHCEHHLAPIIGHAHVGYIPDGCIVGLSKLARLVDAFSRRLQVQERLTNQIADALGDLNPLGIGVLIQADHMCMSTRGAKVHGSVTTTSAMRGVLLKEPEARHEFIELCKMAKL